MNAFDLREEQNNSSLRIQKAITTLSAKKLNIETGQGLQLILDILCSVFRGTKESKIWEKIWRIG